MKLISILSSRKWLNMIKGSGSSKLSDQPIEVTATKDREEVYFLYGSICGGLLVKSADKVGQEIGYYISMSQTLYLK